MAVVDVCFAVVEQRELAVVVVRQIFAVVEGEMADFVEAQISFAVEN